MTYTISIAISRGSLGAASSADADRFVAAVAREVSRLYSEASVDVSLTHGEQCVTVFGPEPDETERALHATIEAVWNDAARYGWAAPPKRDPPKGATKTPVTTMVVRLRIKGDPGDAAQAVKLALDAEGGPLQDAVEDYEGEHGKLRVLSTTSRAARPKGSAASQLERAIGRAPIATPAHLVVVLHKLAEVGALPGVEDTIETASEGDSPRELMVELADGSRLRVTIAALPAEREDVTVTDTCGGRGQRHHVEC